jgi:serine/threonine-protein kinase
VAFESDNLLAGRYRVLKRLGSGGMATVFLAEDQRLSRKVAIKRLHAESPEEVAKRFQREAHLGASLNHPNIVSVFDIETDDENVLIVMEYVAAGTLKDALARGPLPRDAAFRVLEDVASALDYAHEHGVVHRDVKPANVLLDEGGRAKLADLGIATAAEVTKVTMTGSVLGTAAYMAPERLDGHAGGSPADVYGLATVAYEALTGHKARQGRSAVEIAHAVMGEPPPDPRVHLPDAPERAAEVLARGMARDPAERPASAGALVRELSDAFAAAAPAREQTGPTAPLAGAGAGAGAASVHSGKPRPARARSRWLGPALAGAALVLGVVLVLLLASGGGGDGGSGGSKRQASSDTTRAQTQKETSTATSDPAPPAATDTSPEEAVKSFYESAARGDFQGAWQLAGPGLREQLGGYDGMVGTLQSLKSIEFPTLKTTLKSQDAATVEFASVATHPDGVDHCTGTIDLSASGGEWRIEQIHPSCDQQQPSGAPPSQTPGKGPAGGKPTKWKYPGKGHGGE